MVFEIADFNKVENVDRLRVVIMSRMDYYPLKAFKSLPPKKQTEFNRLLNQYINALPLDNEEWNNKLQEDFNSVCVSEIFTEDFDPAKIQTYMGAYKEVEAEVEEENNSVFSDMLKSQAYGTKDTSGNEIESPKKE
jgi:hypothetical protein